MKTFKEFAQIDELKTALPKAGGEKKFVQAHLPPEITEPVASGVTTATKESSGKRKADKLDNKQAFGEASDFDKPDSAKKAYSTIKAKTQNEEHQDALMALFDELNETNQQAFLQKLEDQADKLIEFALSRHEG
jgi:hypothetical protein